VGKVVQNLLSLVKILGLVGIVIAGLLFSSHGSLTSTGVVNGPGLGLALVFVLYAFGGWNDAAFVAAEVRGQKRNMPLALFLGIGMITVVYLLVILAYMTVLGFEGARNTQTPATDVLDTVLGAWGGRTISLLVVICALGAINGLILTGSRVYASLGADHHVFAWLSHWNQRRGAPVAALVAQCAIAVALVLVVGTTTGRTLIDSLLMRMNMSGLDWDGFGGKFETVVVGTAPVFWMFFLLTGLSLFVLRWFDGDRPRPFRTPFFPIPPIIFCGTCGYMLYSSLDYAKWLAIIGIVPLAIGAPLYVLSQLSSRKPNH
jgi:amino acid transporter